MNEKLIGELIKQAEEKASEILQYHGISGEASRWYVFHKVFAELIVKECISAYKSDVSIYEEVNISNILEHFGMNEL